MSSNKNLTHNCYNNDCEFERAVKFVLEMECGKTKDGRLAGDGYVNDPADPGGETKFGISKRAYPGVDIKSMGLAEALGLYYRDYWKLAKSESFPLNLVVFDTAVNMGTKKAAQWLLSCGKDWRLYLENRRQHYLTIVKSQLALRKFLKGWNNRLNELRKFIDIEMAKK